MTDPVCLLYNRSVPKSVPQSSHHLLSKVKGGRHEDTVLLHHQCHKGIHTTLTVSELAKQYNTVAALRTHPRLLKFLKWVAKRPPEFLRRSKNHCGEPMLMGTNATLTAAELL